MHFGYARTSTEDQEAGFEDQKAELTSRGCERIFAEQTSAVGARPQLDAMLAYLRPGDVVTVTKLDRLARSMRDFIAIKDRITSAGASLRVNNLGLDTASATGELILNVLGSVAQFERSMMLERQRAGIAKAKTEGKYRGRVPTAQRQAEAVKALAAEGVARVEIARRLKISRASVYRCLDA